MQANWIGRSEGARVRFPLGGGRRTASTRSRSSPPGRTRCSACRFLAVAPEHPLAAAAAARNPAAAAFVAECRQHGHQRGGDRDGGEARLRHRPARRAPVHRRRDLPGLDRQFRADGIRHRRHLRLPGARPARPRLRPQIRPAGAARGAAAGRGRLSASRSATRPTPATARCINSGFLDGLDVRAGQARGDRARWSDWASARAW